MDYEIVIGLEVHAQLLTRSKMFCGCSAAYQTALPNSHVCPVCLALPGVLPVVNRQAVEYTIMTGLALNCTIPDHSKFDRKNYPYPDLMKGYQISQFDMPLCKSGHLEVDVEGERKRVRINRVHLEEDTAKLFHRVGDDGVRCSLVDVNRSGVPLMEIVSEPDMRSAEEARQYLMKLRNILQYLGVSSGNMEEGSFRCDANVSLRPRGAQELGSKVEVKNMNSFRAVYRALQFEAERQRKALEAGARIVQETRGWVEERGVTVSQRSKEQAHDYRYFPEPDLTPMAVSREWVDGVKAKLPELPDARRDRFAAEYGLPVYDASQLSGSKAMANYFEAAVAEWSRLREKKPAEARAALAKPIANWMLGEFTRLLNAANTEVGQARLTPALLVELVDMVDKGTINQTGAKAVLEEAFQTGKSPAGLVREKGLTQIGDTSELSSVCEQVIAASPQAVADYAAGKEQSLKFLVGQMMKATKGRANPNVAAALLKEKLDARKA